MENDELIKKKECGECICDGCERRFICWTTERIFSDPAHQALYETCIAEGFPSEEAIERVQEFIKIAIARAEQEAERQEEERRTLEAREAATQRARRGAGSRTTPGTGGLLTNVGGAVGLDSILVRR